MRLHQVSLALALEFDDSGWRQPVFGGGVDPDEFLPMRLPDWNCRQQSPNPNRPRERDIEPEIDRIEWIARWVSRRIGFNLARAFLNFGRRGTRRLTNRPRVQYCDFRH